MKKTIAILALLGAIGCGGPVEWQQRDQGGGKWVTTVMTEDEALERRQQAATTNIQYAVDCGSSRDPFENESTLYSAGFFGGSCIATRCTSAGWCHLNFTDVSWSGGGSVNDAVRSHKSHDAAVAGNLGVTFTKGIDGAHEGAAPYRYLVGQGGTWSEPCHNHATALWEASSMNHNWNATSAPGDKVNPGSCN